jgi:hypothetical protein
MLLAMSASRLTLRVVSSSPPATPAPRGDARLLAFLLLLHVVPLVGAAAGRPWGAGVVGYATAIVLLTGRELVRELVPRAADRRARPGDGGRA